MPTRRALLAGLAALSTPLLVRSRAEAQTRAPAPLTVTLLGTGTPVPSPARFGPAVLVQAAGHNLVFDLGRGATMRLEQLKLRPVNIDAAFLTHLHSDHVNGLADFWMTGYFPPQRARATPLPLWGPRGTERLVRFLVEAFAEDVRFRIEDDHAPAVATRIETHEIASDGVIYRANGIVVSAFEVDHGPLVKPAFGYRIDHAGHALVISGDTAPNENLVKFATGCDLLIHEVQAGIADTGAVRHTLPEQAGAIFSRVHPKLAAYTHILTPPDLPAATLVSRTRATYSGPLVVGEDLMRFVIGGGVEVQRWDRQRQGYP